jgi:hypothetical protein
MMKVSEMCLPYLALVGHFTKDRAMGGPETVEEWRGALRLRDASLGIGEHRFSAFVQKIFVDCRPPEAMSPRAPSKKGART